MITHHRNSTGSIRGSRRGLNSKQPAMTRSSAFAIHLTASILVFLVFLGIMIFVGYPAPYFTIDGGWQVLRILGV